MSTAVISLAAGLLIGLVYGLLKVKSPAPPAIALVGLLGMLTGDYVTREALNRHEVALRPVAQAPHIDTAPPLRAPNREAS
ncbi:DUF1427 family protein [Cronobacter dublinensis]|uniref:XapX domain-containing protein n=1 Tax=Cronobacter dublinensis 1210 TaxID=1208656 RepID=A0ABP1WA65_9ENTR|nr:DUF1427 family protein [Cronobacter dublinensis]EGT5713498.1 DUF1427 family protein [Cronobacter dublinensis subsp. dublinensis]CCJ82415.1 Protein of unknown function DUF1427 [Cronobacter dublinensis 1210]ALB68923.1 hypothetical protein AFK67_20585 [Cronobacter dublinensis subsp. dublinensis LMG 23823]EKM6459151.1 DUF1427 family protein [Cronobacter dublinensis]EKY3204889.1 DUF1427 family protein [Cronobacter dublinensis]